MVREHFLRKRSIKKKEENRMNHKYKSFHELDLIEEAKAEDGNSDNGSYNRGRHKEENNPEEENFKEIHVKEEKISDPLINMDAKMRD
jgi:hypothetical protein